MLCICDGGERWEAGADTLHPWLENILEPSRGGASRYPCPTPPAIKGAERHVCLHRPVVRWGAGGRAGGPPTGWL